MRSWLDAILRGMASVVSFGASERPNVWLYPPDEQWETVKRTLRQADADAIASDWRVVGDDLRAAIIATRPGVPLAVDPVDEAAGAR